MAFRDFYIAACKAAALDRIDEDPAVAVADLLRDLAPLYGMPRERLLQASGLTGCHDLAGVRTIIARFT